MKWGTFKDGWPNIFIDEVQTIAGRDGKKIWNFLVSGYDIIY